MIKQEKLNRIYEVIANKELSFGAIVPYGRLIHHYEETIANDEKSIYFYTDKKRIEECDFQLKTIGHPVMIGDCLDWIEPLKETRGIKNIYFYTNTVGDLLKIWKSKRLPVDDQSDECIDYIYSLIK